MKVDFSFSEEQQITIWLAATRYYLGRHSYSVSSFCNLLIFNWNKLFESVRSLIEKEVEEEFRKDDRIRDRNGGFLDHKTVGALGMDCDRKCWEGVRKLWTKTKLENF